MTANWDQTYTNFSTQSANNLNVYSAFNSNSSNYDSVYTTVQTNSANWNYQGTDIKSLTGNWQDTYTDFSVQSANNISVYTTVNQNSATNWNYQGTDIKSLTGNWNQTYTNFSAQSANNLSVYTNVNTNSSNWNYQGTDIKSLTANWDQTYTNFGNQSANNLSVYNNVNSNSANWNYQGTDIKSLTSNWQNTYSTVNSYSATWGTGGSPQTLSFNESNAQLTISDGNTVSLSALSGNSVSSGVSYLSALNDVYIPSSANGQVLTYSSVLQKWTTGSPASASGQTGYYGAFYDTTAQTLTGTNEAKRLGIANTFEANGVSLSANTIVFNNTGTYEIIFSIQYKNTSASQEDIYIWFRKNGVDIPDSSSVFTIPARKSAGIPAQLIAVTPFIATLAANDFIEIYWHCNTTAVTVETFTTHANPTIPDTPGVIITVKQVTNVQLVPTVGAYLPLSGGTITGVLSTTNVIYANGGNSNEWNSSYTTVQTNSATNWNYQGNDIKALTGNWQNTYVNFSSQSANNLNVYTNVNSNSATNWNYQGTDIKSLTSNWQDTYTNFSTQSSNNLNVYTNVNTNSSNWNYQGNDIKSLTGNWQDTYVNFSSQSANNLSVYNNVNSNSATNWNYQGTDIKALTGNWDQTYTNFSTQSANNLSVYSSFNSNSSNYDSVYNNVNSNSATNWNYQGTDIKSLTGNWQASYTALTSSSANWNDTRNTVQTNSANWNYQGTDIKSLTSNWQNTYVNFSSQSANNLNVYTNVNTNSSNWNYQGTDIKSLTSNWDQTYTNFSAQSANNLNVYTAVNSNSANWNYQGTDIKSLTSNWQNTYANFSAQSANNLNVYTAVNSNSANWNDTYVNFSAQSANNLNVYTAVNSNSANWNYQGTDIKSLTSNWNDTYTNFSAQSANNLSVYSTVNSNSASWAPGTVTSVGLSSVYSTLTIGSTPITGSGIFTADINLAKANTWTGQQTFNSAATVHEVGMITPKIYPATDSISAVRILKADGTTNIVTVDTTNQQVGVGGIQEYYKFSTQNIKNVTGIYDDDTGFYFGNNTDQSVKGAYILAQQTNPELWESYVTGLRVEAIDDSSKPSGTITGIHGSAYFNFNGTSYGVQGTSVCPTSSIGIQIGVYGLGADDGVRGRSEREFGAGVRGVAIAANSYALHAEQYSLSGYGLYSSGGKNYIGGKLGLNTTSPVTRLHLIDTSNLFRAGYDTSNYLNIDVGSTGIVTYDAVGSGAVHRFSENIQVPASGYYNFGTTNGSAGYGFRDNAGVVEVKSSGGSWASIGGSAISDDAYDSSWNGVSAIAPSKNAVYDQLQLMQPGGSEFLASDFTTSSTTAVSTNLSFEIAANAIYAVTITGTASKATTNTGLKLAIGAPTGCTIIGEQYGSLATLAAFQTPSLISAINTLGTTFSTGIGIRVTFRLEFLVTNGSTAGNITLQCATVTSNVATIYAGTRMTYTKSIAV